MGSRVKLATSGWSATGWYSSPLFPLPASTASSSSSSRCPTTTRTTVTKRGGGNGGTLESVEKQKRLCHAFHRPLEIAQKRRDSHIPTSPAAIYFSPLWRGRNPKPPGQKCQLCARSKLSTMCRAVQ